MQEFFRHFPEGQQEVCDPPWEVARLCEEVQTPSLFASQRLLLIPHGEPYFALGPAAARALGQALANPAGEVLWVGLFAVLPQPPAGPLVEVLGAVAELEHLALPPPPKPWEEVRLSGEQKALLTQLVAEAAPDLLAQPEVLEALFAAHGFAPGQLVQAARSLWQSGELTAQAARQTAVAWTCSASELEQAGQSANWPRLAYLLGQLAHGAVLESFRGEQASGRRAADLAAGMLARACVAALTVRLLAERAGLATDLDPRRVAQPAWYPRDFKPRIYPKLLAAAGEMPELGVGERSPWALQASFRWAAHCSTLQLVNTVHKLLFGGALRGESAAPWAPLVLAYASLFAACKS
ncbi:MAG: hypothetical protein N2447_04240 [Thermoanaerobaculum sp.]|nr:hypothetical protein [Thermoanaerobaculum sp.]